MSASTVTVTTMGADGKPVELCVGCFIDLPAGAPDFFWEGRRYCAYACALTTFRQRDADRLAKNPVRPRRASSASPEDAMSETQPMPFGDDGTLDVLRGNRSRGRCRDCRASVVWVMSAAKGKSIPFDAEPRILHQFENARGVKFDRVSRRHIHFASCPAKRGKPRCLNADIRHDRSARS
ncbi:MAG TPA: hypothetical protein VHZ73_08440 [Vicinamibacterales bacterium]|jgi:hypothetical protein|nr:hypothetical protein [Vicinamibacterales bacterium]